jgi:hypothetical protein
MLHHRNIHILEHIVVGVACYDAKPPNASEGIKALFRGRIEHQLKFGGAGACAAGKKKARSH